jgi:hypothetical protein
VTREEQSLLEQRAPRERERDRELIKCKKCEEKARSRYDNDGTYIALLLTMIVSTAVSGLIPEASRARTLYVSSR